MSKYGSGSFAVFLVDGYSLLAAKLKGMTWKTESLVEAGHGLGDSWEAPLPTGLQRATLTQDQAFFDDTSAGIHDAFKTASSTARVVGFAPSGNSIGYAFVGLEGTYAHDYAVVATNGSLTKANVTYQISGKLDRGLILSQHASKSGSWNTKTDGNPVDFTTLVPQVTIPITSNTAANPSVVTTPVAHGLTTGDKILISGVATSSPTINGQQTVTVISTTTFSVAVNVTTPGTGGSFVRANTSSGGVGYQFVSVYSGLTGFVGKIQSSPDDVTYTDLLTFTNVTAAQRAERVTVAGTIERYLSFVGTFTGSGAISVFVGFARN